jgi:hypothetical protein
VGNRGAGLKAEIGGARSSCLWGEGVPACGGRVSGIASGLGSARRGLRRGWRAGLGTGHGGRHRQGLGHTKAVGVDARP